MYKRLDRVHRVIPLVLGVVTLIGVGVLLAWHVNPKSFPARAHDFLAAFPLAMIAIAYLLYQSARRPADHDQKHIEDEKCDCNVVEESRLP